MKVLLVGLERFRKLFSMESLFKKKLTEADMTDVEVVTAEMTEFGSPGGRKLERNMNEALRDEADFVVVMEPWQKDLLTRFMDYRNWHKIHLFAVICKRKPKADMPSCDVDFGYRSMKEEMNDGCRNLLEGLKMLLKKHESDSSDLAMI